MAEHNDYGKWGEDMAAQYLTDHGYYIRERNWKCGPRDLDIVAVNDTMNLLVIVEVKTRRNGDIVDPLSAVDEKKIRNLGIAANNYLKSFRLDYEVRFDVIIVEGDNAQTAHLEHIEDAFNPLALY